MKQAQETGNPNVYTIVLKTECSYQKPKSNHNFSEYTVQEMFNKSLFE